MCSLSEAMETITFSLVPSVALESVTLVGMLVDWSSSFRVEIGLSCLKLSLGVVMELRVFFYG